VLPERAEVALKQEIRIEVQNLPQTWQVLLMGRVTLLLTTLPVTAISG
jgi:hypothetical protein